MIKMDHTLIRHANTFVVNWCITNICNFKCAYCMPSLNSGTFPGVALDSAKAFVDQIVAYHKESNREVYFEFTGGEPVLYRDFRKLVSHIKGTGAKVGLISNGTVVRSAYRDILADIDHLCLSFHPKYIADTAVFANEVAMASTITSVHLNVMMDLAYFEKSMEFGAIVKPLLINSTMSLQPLLESLLPGKHVMQYSDEQKIRMEKFATDIVWFKQPFTYRGDMDVTEIDGSINVVKAYELTAKGMNQWKGWKCWTGIDELVIYANGDVYRAWCRQDILGNITNSLIEIPDVPTICRMENCHCNLDIMNRREK